MLPRKHIITILILFLPVIISAQSVEWISKGGSEKSDYGICITSGENDNIYVASHHTDSFLFEIDTLIYSPGSSFGDFIVSAYKKNGTRIWSTGGFSTGSSVVIDIASEGEFCYVAGFYRGVLTLGNFTVNSIGYNEPFAYNDAFVAKLDKTGKVSWLNSLGSKSHEYFGSISVDNAGNVYCGGFFNDTIFNNADTIIPYLNSQDGIIAKYNKDGVLVSTLVIGGRQNDQVHDIYAENDSSLIVITALKDTVLFKNDTLSTIPTTTIGILKIINGTKIEWKKIISSADPLDINPIRGTAYNLGFINDSSIVVLGNSPGIVTIVDNDSLNIDRSFLFDFNLEGKLINKLSLSNLYYYFFKYDILKDRYENYLLIGKSNSIGGVLSRLDGLPGGTIIPGGNSISKTITKFNKKGEVLWEYPKDDDNGLLGVGACIDNSDRIFATGGYRSGTIINDSDTLETRSPCCLSDFFIAEIKDVQNIISGTVFLDSNGNGLRDSAEIFLSNQIIKVQPGPIYRTTNNDGKYILAVDSGDFTITFPEVQKKYVMVTTPGLNEHQVSFTDNFGADDSDNDFGIAHAPNIEDMSLSLALNGISRLNNTVCYNLTYKNDGTKLSKGIIKFHVNSSANILEAIPSNAYFIGDTIGWDYDSLAPGEQNTIEIKVIIPSSINLLGDSLSAFGIVIPTSKDTFPTDNKENLTNIITGSYDPNTKEVIPVGEGVEGLIPMKTANFTYTIKFQNTGTDTAFKVVVTDTLSSLLKPETFKMLSSSHEVNYEIVDKGTIIWTFDPIILPDSNNSELESHGYVKFSISRVDTITEGDKINNSGNIYFDLNPPVITDTAVNTFTSLITSAYNIINEGGYLIYPNPTKDFLNIESKNEFVESFSVQILNIEGKVLVNKDIPNTQKVSLSTTSLPAGMYFIRLFSDEDVQVIKFIKARQ